MSISMSVLVGAAIKTTLSAKFSDHLEGKLDLKDFFSLFKSGKTNDLALKLQKNLDAFAAALSDLGDEITALHANLEQVEDLVLDGIEADYAGAIRDLNTEARSILQEILLSGEDDTQTWEELQLSRSNSLLNGAIAEIGALVADPNVSAEFLAASAFPTLTNAVATRVAVVKKYSDKGLAFTTIAESIEDAADLLAEVYASGGAIDAKAAAQVQSTVEQVSGYSTGILVVESTGPGGHSRTDYIGESSYFSLGQVIPDHFGEIAGETITYAGSDPWEMAQTLSGVPLALADGDPPQIGLHASYIAGDFVAELRDKLDPDAAVQDITALTQGVSLTLGAGEDTETGTDFADYIHGGEGDDVISGAMGSDALHGGEGMDDISGGRGHDRLYGGENQDTVKAGRGDDIVEGGGGRDVIEGGAGHDILYQSSRALSGGAADQDDGGLITGGDGNDDIYGDAGQDILFGGEGRDLIRGGDGGDTVMGEAGNDNLFGNGGNDLIGGGQGDDTLEGGKGHDILHGGFGEDVLIGGAGWNWVYGGDGLDVARIDGTISQFDFAQLEDGTLAIFGATNASLPVTFVMTRPDSQWDRVEVLQFDDVAITNHWHPAAPPSSFIPVPEEPSTPFGHTDEFTFETDPIDPGFYIREIDALRLRQKEDDRGGTATRAETFEIVPEEGGQFAVSDGFLF